VHAAFRCPGRRACAREHPDGTGRSFTIQTPLDATGSNSGDETYCLVLDPGQHTFYGAITTWGVVGHTLAIQLTADAARALHVPPALQFQLDVPDDHLARLQAGLHRALPTSPDDN
jgi:hypothetical protein